jgi:diguanylate cyclase (GGDEF)-like protein
MFRTIQVLNYLSRQHILIRWAIVLLSLTGVGILDYVTGPDIAVSLFYLIAVALASWSLSKTAGTVVAVFSGILWEGMRVLGGGQSSGPLMIAWNIVVRAGIFTITAGLISEVHLLLEQKTTLSRLDSLTGALNRGAFLEAAEAELERVRRNPRPFTITFLDLDDFKELNDHQGHHAGDALLQRVTARMQSLLRRTDTVGRLGGDEFAMLFPEMNGPAARAALPRLQDALLAEMASSQWPVTFSLGVLTCNVPPSDAEDMIHRADKLMYTAKHRGKNSIEYGLYPSATEHTIPRSSVRASKPS